MSHPGYLECVGGPLDGRRARVGPVFPWPCGWYYAQRWRESDEMIFVWVGQCWIDLDADRHAREPHEVLS